MAEAAHRSRGSVEQGEEEKGMVAGVRGGWRLGEPGLRRVRQNNQGGEAIYSRGRRRPGSAWRGDAW